MADILGSVLNFALQKKLATDQFEKQKQLLQMRREATIGLGSGKEQTRLQQEQMRQAGGIQKVGTTAESKFLGILAKESPAEATELFYREEIQPPGLRPPGAPGLLDALKAVKEKTFALQERQSQIPMQIQEARAKGDTEKVASLQAEMELVPSHIAHAKAQERHMLINRGDLGTVTKAIDEGKQTMQNLRLQHKDLTTSLKDMLKGGTLRKQVETQLEDFKSQAEIAETKRWEAERASSLIETQLREGKQTLLGQRRQSGEGETGEKREKMPLSERRKAERLVIAEAKTKLVEYENDLQTAQKTAQPEAIAIIEKKIAGAKSVINEGLRAIQPRRRSSEPSAIEKHENIRVYLEGELKNKREQEQQFLAARNDAIRLFKDTQTNFVEGKRELRSVISRIDQDISRENMELEPLESRRDKLQEEFQSQKAEQLEKRKFLKGRIEGLRKGQESRQALKEQKVALKAQKSMIGILNKVGLTDEAFKLERGELDLDDPAQVAELQTKVTEQAQEKREYWQEDREFKRQLQLGAFGLRQKGEKKRDLQEIYNMKKTNLDRLQKENQTLLQRREESGLVSSEAKRLRELPGLIQQADEEFQEAEEERNQALSPKKKGLRTREQEPQKITKPPRQKSTKAQFSGDLE